MQATEIVSPKEPQDERAREAERRQALRSAAGLNPVDLVFVFIPAVDEDAPAGGGDIPIPVDVRPVGELDDEATRDAGLWVPRTQSRQATCTYSSRSPHAAEFWNPTGFWNLTPDFPEPLRDQCLRKLVALTRASYHDGGDGEGPAEAHLRA